LPNFGKIRYPAFRSTWICSGSGKVKLSFLNFFRVWSRVSSNAVEEPAERRVEIHKRHLQAMRQRIAQECRFSLQILDLATLAAAGNIPSLLCPILAPEGPSLLQAVVIHKAAASGDLLECRSWRCRAWSTP